MQTFLPYTKWSYIAKCLDFRRLNAQINEAKAILTILAKNENKGYSKHPAVLMWSGYESALCIYRNIMLNEFKERGGKCSRTATIPEKIIWPAWKEDLHLIMSHRAMLLKKQPEHYEKFFEEVYPYEDYFWPTKNGYEVQPTTLV